MALARNDVRRTTVAVAGGDMQERVDRGAPLQMEGIGDTTWNGADADGKCCDVYALSVNINGASVCVEVKRTDVAGSSAEQEGLVLLKLSDKVVWLRHVAAKYGMPQDGPTPLHSDCDAALRVAAGQSSAARLRHALRRSAIVTHRVRDTEEASLVHRCRVACPCG